MGVVLSSKTTFPLGSSGHLFGSMGQSRRSVGLGSGQSVYVQGRECGKVRKSEARRAERSEGMKIQDHSKGDWKHLKIEKANE